MNTNIEQDGFAIVSQIIESHERQELLASFGPVAGAGLRGLLAIPAVAELARSSRVIDLVRRHMRSEPIPVRSIYFDKSPDTNWLVPWHQDLSIAVRARREVPGFGPWSMKEGVPHVQPPVELLEQMITVRIHLDDADESNGALRVLPGSHRFGLLSSQSIQRLRSELSDVVCTASAGDALLMRPLLLHASGKSTSTRHRRVLHIEYAAFDLPEGLDWHEAA